MTAATNCCLFGLGVAFLVVGVSLGIAWPYIFNTMLHTKLELRNGSDAYHLWVKTPIPMYLELYLFNWTNADEFLRNKSVKPDFREVGPFVFLEVHERKGVVWNYNGTVTYNQTRTWTFQPDMSEDIKMNVTNLNALATTVAYMRRFDSSTLKYLLNIAMHLENLIVTKPAEEWLFKGMDDKLLDVLNSLHISLPFDKFGFFYKRNESASYDGRFTVDTGVADVNKLGDLQTWNGMTETPYFDGACGAVGGTTGEVMGPLTTNKQIFITDICRGIKLNGWGSDTVQGLTGIRLEAGMSEFDNGTLWPEMKCYCRAGDECLNRGVANISACRWGSPLFASYPHFYLADESYTRAVSGMHPNKTEHQFYIIVEPTTGTPLEVRAQLQINMLLQPFPWLTMYKSVPRVMIPMLWFRERASLTPDLLSMTRLVVLLSVIPGAVAYALAGIGVVILTARLATVLWRHHKTRASHSDTEVLISDDAADSLPS